MKVSKLSWLISSLLLTGCGNSLSCAFYGDNVNGRIIFGDHAPAGAQRTQLVVEFSKDGFATKDSKAINNLQGFISVPYSVCAENNVNFTVRAFADENNDGKWDAGEGAGRDDGTTDGHAAYITRNIPRTAPANSNSSSDWKKIGNVDIWIDSGVSQ